MTIKELFSEIKIISCRGCNNETEITGISHDSKNLKPGDMFVAMSGTKADGHGYIREAAENGAVVTVVERVTEYLIKTDTPYIEVESTRTVFSKLWSAFCGHPERDIDIIAVTGTNGKTTVCSLIYSILKESGRKCGLVGTVCNLYGGKEVRSIATSPDPDEFFPMLKDMKECGTEVLVMEMSSHALALDKYSGIRFKIGIFTNLSHDHLDFHGDMNNYFKAKLKLFYSCENALVNADDVYGREIITQCTAKNIYSYSVSDFNSDFLAKNIKLKGVNGVEYRFYTFGKSFDICSYMCGMFTVYNTLAAVSCARILGICIKDIQDAIRKQTSVKGRLERINTGTDFYVYIDFAHTPDALLNVLKTVRNFGDGRVITVFGCGGERDREKRPEMGEIASRYSDICVITSDNSRSENAEDIINDIRKGIIDYSNCKAIVSRDCAIEYALKEAKTGDIVLLCGKGHEEYCTDSEGTRPYSERETVKRILGKIK